MIDELPKEELEAAGEEIKIEPVADEPKVRKEPLERHLYAISEPWSLALRQILTDFNLSQRDVARRLGVHEVQVHRWIVGKHKPRKRNMKKIQSEFGIKVGEFGVIKPEPEIVIPPIPPGPVA